MPTLTRRRILVYGGKALAMTLPKAWTDFYQVSHGDQLEVIAGDTLIVYPPLRTIGNDRDDSEEA